MCPHGESAFAGKQLLLGVWGGSSIGALLLIPQGPMPLLLSHNTRVRFPTTLCTLSWGRGLSFVESDGVNRSICTPCLGPFLWAATSKWLLDCGFSFLAQVSVSLFLQFKRFIPGLRRLRHTLLHTAAHKSSPHCR